jgi:hypothetical protein
MHQLGAGFINSVLLPYIQDKILGKIKNDTRLQNIFRYDKILTPEELNGLENTYFKTPGTLLERDIDLRKAFWKEFIGFVKGQKKLCNGSNLKLTFRLLPDAKGGGFSQEARQNWQKFAFYAVSGMENILIQRKIDSKKINGKISSAQAENDKVVLKNGKMILVRQKDGNFDYMSNETVASAIGNAEKTARLFADLDIQQTSEGETRVFPMNPTELPQGDAEISLGLNGVQALLWEKQSMQSEKQLEDNGLYIETHMTVDGNGVAQGKAQDKNGTRLIIEFDIKKPGERGYRITFADNPANKFFISENELKQKFGNGNGQGNKSALEVFKEKEDAAGKGNGVVKPKGSRISDKVRGIKLPKNRKIKMPNGGAVSSSTGMAADSAYKLPIPRKTVVFKLPYKNNSNVVNGTNFSGPIDAKLMFEAARKGEPNNDIAEMETLIPSAMGGDKKNQNHGKLKASGRQNEKSPMGQVAKLYAAIFGGTIGSSVFLSLLT